jgi:hypothetical protein
VVGTPSLTEAEYVHAVQSELTVDDRVVDPYWMAGIPQAGEKQLTSIGGVDTE